MIWPGVVVMTYSRPSGVKPPIPLDRIRSRRGDSKAPGVSSCRGRLGLRRGARALRRRGSVDLFRQGPPAVAEDDAGDGLEQGAVFLRDLLRRAHEDAARPVHRLGFEAHRHQTQDLVLQHLPIAGAVFVPDHQVHRQPLQAPVGMGLDELAHQLDIGQVADAQQHDGQVAGNGIAPQAGLPAPVPHEHAAVGAQRGIGVDDRVGQAPVELRVRLARVDLSQHHLGVGPGQLEDAVGEAPILIFLDQAQGRVAAVADAVNQVHVGRLFRLEADPAADGHHRVQHRALAAGQRRGIVHRLGRGDGAAAADEARAVGLVGKLAGVRVVHGHQVEHPGHRLVAGAGPARAEDGPVRFGDLGLHEEIAERRMQRVAGGGASTTSA